VKFLIDASLPPWMIDDFAAEGHDALHADDLGIGHAPDSEIAKEAGEAARCIVTRDFDFADLRNYRPAAHRGIIVLTIPRHRGSAYMRFLLGTLFDYLRDDGAVDQKLLIIDADRIRVRP
jgi:GNAT superfamily N-acetyltransferase